MVIMLPLKEGGIGLVHMPVNHDGRTVAVQQGTETLEPAVRRMILITEPPDRRVRQQDIKTACRAQLPAE